MLFKEICDLLVKYTGRPDFTNEMWFKSLKALFKIKQETSKSTRKDREKSVYRVLYKRISEFLQLMSKYVDFNDVLEMLLESDSTATFQYAKEWLKTIFVSQNNQEFLYKSAKKLLENETTIMIDNLYEQHDAGLKGSVVVTCSIWLQMLGAVYRNSELIFWVCNHSFHSKCYHEEMQILYSKETISKSDQKPDCPICRQNAVVIDENQKRKAKITGSKRRRKNHKESENESSEDSINTAAYEDKDSMGIHKMTAEEEKKKNEMIYRHKLAVFDEDYNSFMPSISLV